MTESTALFPYVLLVEDDDSHAFLVKRALQPLVGEVNHVRTLATAETSLKQKRADLIITDLHLPDSAGAGIITTLLQLAPPPPILVLTSSTSVEDGVQAMKLGARQMPHALQPNDHDATSHVCAQATRCACQPVGWPQLWLFPSTHIPIPIAQGVPVAAHPGAPA